MSKDIFVDRQRAGHRHNCSGDVVVVGAEVVVGAGVVMGARVVVGARVGLALVVVGA